jgi:hypothetical protein
MPKGSQDTPEVPLPTSYNAYSHSHLSLTYEQRHYTPDAHALPSDQQILEEEA